MGTQFWDSSKNSPRSIEEWGCSTSILPITILQVFDNCYQISPHFQTKYSYFFQPVLKSQVAQVSNDFCNSLLDSMPVSFLK